MARPRHNRPTFSIHNQEELMAAKIALENSTATYESVGILITDPSLLVSSASDLTSLADTLSKTMLQEVRLAVRGPGKLATHEEIENTVDADAVADLLTGLSGLKIPLSLELSVSNVKGSLHRLCTAIAQSQDLFRCVLHECNNEDDVRQQGMLPVLEALSQSGQLHTLVLEAIQLPVGDITSAVLVKLATHSHLKRLEINHCIDLGDEELVDMVSSITAPLQHLKLSTGMGLNQAHTGRQWGTRTVAALAAKLRDPACSITSLALTTSDAQVSLRPIVRATQVNTSLQRLHLTPSPQQQKRTSTSMSLGQELIQILEQNHNTTLQQCNGMGLSYPDMPTLQFYTRLNQLKRQEIFASFGQNNNHLWLETLLEQSNDHRIVHYLLTHNPLLLLNANSH